MRILAPLFVCFAMTAAAVDFPVDALKPLDGNSVITIKGPLKLNRMSTPPSPTTGASLWVNSLDQLKLTTSSGTVSIGAAGPSTGTTTSILKGDGSGGFAEAVAGTDYQAHYANLNALGALVSAANKLPYFTGSGSASLTDFSSAARSLLDDADASGMRTTLGVRIGTDVQAYNANLSALAGLTGEVAKLPRFTGAGAMDTISISGAGVSWLEAIGAEDWLAMLGLMNEAGVAFGGTGASTPEGARSRLGLVIGTNVLAPNGNGSSLTSLNASNISSGSLGLARLSTSGATTGDVLTFNGTNYAPAAASGGTSNVTAAAWVQASGNDSTGTVGDSAKPYATMQAAFDDGARHFELAGETFAGISHVGSGNFRITFRGRGAKQTTITAISVGGLAPGNQVMVQDVGHKSATIGDISFTGAHAVTAASSGATLGDASFRGLSISGNLTFAAGDGADDDDDNASAGGSLSGTLWEMVDCEANIVTLSAGAGGTTSGVDHNGGDGGSINYGGITLAHCELGAVNIVGGYGGTGGAETGFGGAAGDVTVTTVLSDCTLAYLAQNAGVPGSGSAPGAAPTNWGTVRLRRVSMDELEIFDVGNNLALSAELTEVDSFLGSSPASITGSFARLSGSDL